MTGACRVCGNTYQLENCHVIPRSLGGTQTIWMCSTCHRAQHAHEIELAPYLTREEAAQAVMDVGLGRAYRYLTNERAA